MNFITAWDNQGFIVREFSLIAKNYLRSWFLPDFSGSFPFDKTIAAFIDADGQTLQSTTFIRALKLIKMLKLIRAIKFMNKLEKLKQTQKEKVKCERKDGKAAAALGRFVAEPSSRTRSQPRRRRRGGPEKQVEFWTPTG